MQPRKPIMSSPFPLGKFDETFFLGEQRVRMTFPVPTCLDVYGAALSLTAQVYTEMGDLQKLYSLFLLCTKQSSLIDDSVKTLITRNRIQMRSNSK